MFEFNLISGKTIKALLDRDLAACINAVSDAYLAFHDGQAINPDSYFLRFPDHPENRIIALPATLKAGYEVAGIKWISSFPGNLNQDIPRASAVLILNDLETGHPFALLEGAYISAVRTAASAVLGAYWLNQQSRQAASISFIGAGVIARHILTMFAADHWQFEHLMVHDTVASSASQLVNHATQHFGHASSVSLSAALEADIVVFATNAATPYVLPPRQFFAGQLILNISLRDLAPELIIAADNFFDDVAHCLKANTSPHLAEQLIGHRGFVTANLAQVIRSEVQVNRAKALIYSPFGMGILDLALGKKVYDLARAENLCLAVPDFFSETKRW